MKMKIKGFTLHKTQFDTLGFAQIGPGCWSFFVECQQVGPIYPTRETLLADLHRYAIEYGLTY